jgi:ribonuclease D
MESGQKRYTDALLQCIKRAKALPQEQWPKQPDFKKLSTGQEALVDILMAIVKTRASQNDISANSLASRKELTALVLGKQDCTISTGWRYELAGKDVQDFIDGHSRIQTVNGELEIAPVAKAVV